MDMFRVRFFALACATLLLFLPVWLRPNAAGAQDYGTVVGRVYDARTNQPLNDVVVSVGPLTTAHSGPDGSFTLTHAPAGEQTLTVYPPPGYLSPKPVRITVESEQTVAAPAIGLTPAS